MKDKFRFLPKEERKKILLLSDDIRLHSGVGTMAREIIINSAHHFNWVNLGGAVKHDQEGKAFDISEDVNKHAGLDDASVKIIPSSGYGDAMKIRQLIKMEKPDALFLFTDPRYWVWLFEIEREIRSKIPIFYLNIWDDYPAPLYNKNFYNSVDVLLAISKQTKNINEIVLGEYADDKIIEYVPHGINEKFFFPIDESFEQYEEYQNFRKNIFGDKEIEFVAFYNSRNIRRKSPGDVILAYRNFCDRIGKEKAKKCALIMHTSPVDNNGTDLFAVKEAFCDPEYVNVFFSREKLASEQMNLLYNIADVNVLISSNEGWGLSLTEAMMTGTMIIANATGGMQDQMRFSKDGKWIDFTPEFPSNHLGSVKEHGEWAVPVFPSNRSLVGSPPTPYIFDDRCSIEDVGAALEFTYNLGPEERKKRGIAGREWARSEEAGFTAIKMANRVIEYCDRGFEEFIPRPRYEIHKAVDRPRKYITHNLFGY